MPMTISPATFKTWKWGVFLLNGIMVLIAGGCHHASIPVYTPEPLPLEKAVRLMTTDLLQQISANRKADNPEIIMDTMIESETGEVTQTTRLIEQVIASQARSFPELKVSNMTEKTAKTANYVLNGVIHLEEYGANADKIIQLSASIVDMNTSRVAAHSEALIADKTLESEPTSMYRDSPMYIKDKRVQSFIETAQARVGGSVDKEYIGTLVTSALLNEAEAVYNAGDYKRAAELFSKVAAQDDGKIMKTYSGLYESQFRLGYKDLAEESFSSLVDLGIKNRNLSMKFLFKPGRTIFVEDSDVRAEYPIWLRQLAKHISNTGVCLHIIGHASKAGEEKPGEKIK